MKIRVLDANKVEMRELPPARPRLAALPAAVALQWRVCPFRPIAAMEVGDSPWIRYEDPELGPCYFWRPLDRSRWQGIAERVREDRLAEVHPYLADAVRELAVRAAAAGIELRVIHSVSEVSIFRPKWKAAKKSAGKGSGKPHKKPFRTTAYTFLHPWGLAVDMTIGWQQPLLNPDRKYRAGTAVWTAFRQLGAWAEELGVNWLGRTVKGELAHFEFHPGGWGTIAGAELQTMLALRRAGGPRKAHEALLADPARIGGFAALRDAIPFP